MRTYEAPKILPPQLDFADVMFKPEPNDYVSRKDVDLSIAHTFKHSKETYEGVPIIAANMDGVGTITMAKAFAEDGNGLTVALRKHYSVEELIEYFGKNGFESAWYSIGTSPADQEKLQKFLDSGCVENLDRLCIDVANAYRTSFVEFIAEMRERFPNTTIMAGNVVTGDMVQTLINAGADIIKVGIGPGSVCTTRQEAGVGRPQLSAVLECAAAAREVGGHICSDGGCAYPSDISKAFGAGADFVMSGGMLSGHDQGESEIIEKADGSKVTIFYGMSSDTAMVKHAGEVAGYRASEGKTVESSYKGNVHDTIRHILGGMRSTVTYVGAESLADLPSKTSFYPVSRQLSPMFK